MILQVKKQLLLHFALFLLLSTGNAQNLITNGSFETLLEKITEPSSHLSLNYSKYKTNGYLNSLIPPWQNMYAGSPYIIDKKINKAPHQIGYKLDVQPRDGSIMLGFKIHGLKKIGDLIYIKLNQETTANINYKVSCWKANSIYSQYISQNVYFLFTNDPQKVIENEEQYDFQELKPQETGHEIKELKEWKYLATNYQANKAYNYLVIGSRYASTDYQPSSTTVPKKHTIDAVLYYIDDIEIVESAVVTPPLVKKSSPKLKKKPVLKKETFTLQNIDFQNDSYILDAKSKATLQELHTKIKLLNILKISIDGHTNAVGTEIYNKELSEKRAKAVYNYLAKIGAATDIMSFFGHGEEQLLDTLNPNTDKNRRVEITVTYNQQ